MDGDIGEMLRSVMSDPEQMAQIASVARSLMGGEEAQAQAPPPPAAESGPPRTEPPVPGADRLLSLLGKSLSGKGETARSAALLTTMRPYMKPEKQEKLDRAMQIARMARIAGTVMREFGGSDHGI